MFIKSFFSAELRKFKNVFVSCPTEKIYRFYSDIVDHECIFNNYNKKWANKIFEKITEINSKKPDKERKIYY